MKKINQRKYQQLLGTVILLFLAAVWGLAFVFQKMALDAGMTTSSLIFIRFFVGAMSMGLICGRQIRANYQPGQWKAGAVVGVLFFAATFIQMIGLGQTTPGNNALITGANVIIVPFICWVVTKKRPPVLIILSAVLSFTGIAVLSLNFDTPFLMSGGDAVTLVGAFFFAAYIFAVGETAGNIHFSVLAFTQMTVVAGLSLLAVLAEGRGISGITGQEGWIAVFYMGILATGLGITLQMIAQKFVSSTLAAILVSTECLLGTVFSVIMGSDVFSKRLVWGGAILFCSIVIANLASLFKGKLEMKGEGLQRLNSKKLTRKTE